MTSSGPLRPGGFASPGNAGLGGQATDPPGRERRGPYRPVASCRILRAGAEAYQSRPVLTSNKYRSHEQ